MKKKNRESDGKKKKSLHSVLKNNKNLKESSRRWLQRHIDDPYVKKSVLEGYRSRSAYKLIEIDERYGLLKPGARVIDLGASPGGWSQVAAERVGSGRHAKNVIALDLLEMEPLSGVTFFMIDFFEEEAPSRILEELGGASPDVILSDMACPTIGHRYTDHLRTMNLCEAAAEFALNVLGSGGHFLAKTFQGGTQIELLSTLKLHFQSVYHVKPPASRSQSPELYILAKNFRGKAEDWMKKSKKTSF